MSMLERKGRESKKNKSEFLLHFTHTPLENQDCSAHPGARGILEQKQLRTGFVFHAVKRGWPFLLVLMIILFWLTGLQRELLSDVFLDFCKRFLNFRGCC